MRAVSDGINISVALSASVELEKEVKSLRDRATRIDSQIAAIEAELARPGFTQQAPASFQLMTRYCYSL